MIRLIIATLALVLLPTVCWGAMYNIYVLTPFTGSGTKEDSNRPAFKEDYACPKFEDVTGVPGSIKIGENGPSDGLIGILQNVWYTLPNPPASYTDMQFVDPGSKAQLKSELFEKDIAGNRFQFKGVPGVTLLAGLIVEFYTSNIPTDPNVYVGRFECSDNITSAIISDGGYLVLSSEIIQSAGPGETPVTGDPALTIAQDVVPDGSEIANTAQQLSDMYGFIYGGDGKPVSLQTNLNCKPPRICQAQQVTAANQMSATQASQQWDGMTRRQIRYQLQEQMKALPKAQ